MRSVDEIDDLSLSQAPHATDAARRPIDVTSLRVCVPARLRTESGTARRSTRVVSI